MGLFDRKRDVTPASPDPEPAPMRSEPPPPEPEVTRDEPPRASASASAALRPSTYGIQNAIELMRKLPTENVALVVEVVKKTLESLHVDIAAIIDDAERKQARIDERVANLEEEIADYEEEIAGRREEIAALTADREETHLVKERLEMAQKGESTPSRSRDTLPPQNRSPVPKPASSFAASPPRPPLGDRPEAEHE